MNGQSDFNYGNSRSPFDKLRANGKIIQSFLSAARKQRTGLMSRYTPAAKPVNNIP